MEELTTLIELENPPPEFNSSGKPIPPQPVDFYSAFYHYYALYLGYISCVRKINDCYYQKVHTQKRRDLKLALDAVMSRLIQVKHELIRFNPSGIQSDFVHLTDALLAHRQTPNELELPVPNAFKERLENEEAAKKREVLDKYLEEHGIQQIIEEIPLPVPKMTREQAIKIIQKNERGRQGMVRAKLMKEFREEDMLRRRLSGAAPGDSDAPKLDPNLAATLIQKVFRGFSSRKASKQAAKEELKFLGLRPADESKVQGPAADGKPRYDPIAKEEAIRKQRKIRQAENELKYIESLVNYQQEIQDREGAEMKDQMWEERYQWWIEQKGKTGKYPKDLNNFYKEKGLMPETKKKGKSAATPAAQPAKGKAAAAQSGKGSGAKKSEEEKLMEENLVYIGPSPLVNHLKECVDRFQCVWSQLDESDNPAQIHDEQIAKEKLRPLVAERIRQEVDEKLVEFLDNIRLKVVQKQAELKAKKQKLKEKKKAKQEEEAKESGFSSGPTSPKAASGKGKKGK